MALTQLLGDAVAAVRELAAAVRELATVARERLEYTEHRRGERPPR